MSIKSIRNSIRLCESYPAIRDHAPMDRRRAMTVQHPAWALPARHAACLVLYTMCDLLVYHNTTHFRIAYCKDLHRPVGNRGRDENAHAILLQTTCGYTSSLLRATMTGENCVCNAGIVGLLHHTDSSLPVGMYSSRRVMCMRLRRHARSACMVQRQGSTHSCHATNQMLEEVIDFVTSRMSM